jgi:outer membrane protein
MNAVAAAIPARIAPRTSPYLLAALVALLGVAATTPAVASDFMVRARALQLDPANDGFGVGSSVQVNSKLIWEVDASWFATPNVALELIATTPQKQTVYLGDQVPANKLGTLRHLPPTLTIQYHFAPSHPTVRPYIGVGVNYTHFSAVNLGGLDVDRHSWGSAVQLGADFPITDKLSINVDFKKIDIRTRVYSGQTELGTIKIDPVLFGVGIGYRF